MHHAGGRDGGAHQQCGGSEDQGEDDGPEEDDQGEDAGADQPEVRAEGADGTVHDERFDFLLAATGRRPNVDRLGLEHTTLPLDPQGVPVFDRRTGQVGDSAVFMAGDAADDRALLHEAADDGRIAGDNAGRWPAVRLRPRRAPLSGAKRY